MPSPKARLALASALFFALSGCCCDDPCAPKPPPPRPNLDVPDPAPNAQWNAVPTPLARGEAPEARNERLMRLEWAEDQWWAATQKQEYEQQAKLEDLLRSYVAEHFDAIASDLVHGSPRHRRTMAMALGFSERQDAVPILTESLKDQYFEVVLHSLLALYQLTKLDPSAAGAMHNKPQIFVDPEIVVPYLRHPNEKVRSNAALVLSKTLGPNPSKSLLLVVVASTEDVDAATRAHAVAALGSTNDREVFPYLVKALRDQVQLVRIRAALAIGRLNEPDGVPYLIGVLEDKTEKVDVQRAAAKALGEIMGTTEIDSLEPSVWRAAAAKMKIEGAPPKKQ
jgi:HEAT repeats